MDYQQLPSPAFVLDESRLQKNLELISHVQSETGVEILLAFKGFAMWSTFPLVREYIRTATASSLNEARLCFEQLHERAHVYAPAYGSDELDGLLPLSSHITFNSLSQFERFYPRVKASGMDISCGLRVNPEYSDVTTDLYNPASPQSRLGVLHDALPATLPEGIEGLHFHVLCESDSTSLERTLHAFEKRFGKYLPHMKWVNFGGGHLMTRKGYDVAHLMKLLQQFKTKYPLEVFLEPGSAFAWDTGVLVSEVLDIVQSRGVRTAILNVSFTAHMPDTLEMPYRPRIVGAKEPGRNSRHLYRLGGCSCLAGDFMECYDFGRELKVGDRVVFEDMIHYTMVKTTMFNGVHHPDIAIWRRNGQLDVVRRFDYSDYSGRLS